MRAACRNAARAGPVVPGVDPRLQAASLAAEISDAFSNRAVDKGRVAMNAARSSSGGVTVSSEIP